MTAPLALYQYGDPRRPPIVLLHPGGMLHSVWLPFIRMWQHHYHILAVDLRMPINKPISIPDLAPQVTALIERHSHAPIWLIGASLGANVALQIATATSPPLAGLILDSAQAGGPPPAVLRSVVWILNGVVRLVPQRLVTRLLLRPFRTYCPSDQAAIRKDIDQLGKHGFLTHIAAHFAYDVRHKLDQIHVPTLILAGERDLLTRTGEPLKLKAGIKTATLELAPGAGHVTFLAQPEQFQTRVTAFLSQHSALL
jgi:pimeloyl-ACP methyl ester carboxylesterase